MSGSTAGRSSAGSYRKLAHELRGRRLEESAVASALANVHAECRRTGRDPAVIFGCPADHAATFDRGRTRRWSFLVITAATGIVTNESFHRTASLEHALTTWTLGPVTAPWLVGALVLCAGAAAVQLFQRRLPRSFRRTLAG